MTASLTLRPYTPADLDACAAIWRAASEAGHPFLAGADLDADEALVRDVYFPQAEITLACDGARPVGFVAMIGSFIGALFVAPDQHRRGIGRMLVAAVAQTHGPLVVEVYAENAGACRFYGALGFTETGRRDMDDRGRAHPLVRMEQTGGT
ncbi:MAG: GNAT family N-acetyltransferase [Pararhodobacter sp.]|nr:GNAT family N-acetyltransferase [Pararhodobacter sp.]